MTAFGETWINEVRSLFSKPTADGRTQWQKTVQDAIEPRERHHIISRLRDEFDCISVGQFQNIIERYFDQIFPQLTDSPSKKSTRSSILELVRNVTAVRNAISHPSERDIDSWDALRLIDNVRRVLIHFERSEVSEVEELGLILSDQLDLLGEWRRCVTRHLSRLVDPPSVKHDYVHRLKIEDKLLDDADILLIGRPGAGKSTTLRALVREHAKGALEQPTYHRVPCILQIVGDDNIIQKVAGELQAPEHQVRRQLERGAFWILFDGVDELVEFKRNFPRIVDFVKLFSKNKYTISARREYYENSETADYFHDLISSPRLRHFHLLELGEMSGVETAEMIATRFKGPLRQDELDYINTTLNAFPDLTPLLIEIALELLEKLGTIAYEIPGRLYGEFFSARLKRECKKIKTLGRGAWIQVDSSLVHIGAQMAKDGTSRLNTDSALATIREKAGGLTEDLHELLIRSEILRPIESKQGGAEQIQFYHSTYRDYYVARALLGKLTDLHLREEMIDRATDIGPLIFVCGLEESKEIVASIISQALEKDNIPLAVECICNTGHEVASSITSLMHVLKAKIKIDRFWLRWTVDRIYKYPRLCGADLVHFLERELENDKVLKIDWEILKQKLGLIDEVDKRYKMSFRYEFRVYPSKIKLHDMIPLFAEIADCPEAQDDRGYEFYQELCTINSTEDMLDLAADKKYNHSIRAYIINEIIDESMDDTSPYVIEDLIKRLDAKGELFAGYGETFMWVVMGVCLLYGPRNDRVIAQLLKHFWVEKSAVVQARIVYHLWHVENRLLAQEFARDVVRKYKCDFIVNVKRLEGLSLFSPGLYEDQDLRIDSDTEIAGDFYLRDFMDETYEIFVKCLAINFLGGSKDTGSHDLLLASTHHDNEKVRTVAIWAYENLNR